MADSPLAAVHAHLDALNAKVQAQITRSMAFPFVHMRPDGTKSLWETPGDVPDFTNPPYHRTEFAGIETLVETTDVVVFQVRFKAYDTEDVPIQSARGLWGVFAGLDGWLVGWRQFLGED